MSERVIQAVALLTEERAAQDAEGKRLDALVNERVQRLGIEAANRDAETLALNAQCMLAISRAYACTRAIRLLDENFQV